MSFNTPRNSAAALVAILLVTLSSTCSGGGTQVDDADHARSSGDSGGERSALVGQGPPKGLGATLAFHSFRQGRSKIFLFEAASGGIRQLTYGSDHHDEEPAWSADGRKIAFSTTRFDGRTFDLAVMNADGTGVRRVTSEVALDRDPEWMPDGASLVFTREDDSGPAAIYRVGLSDGRAERVSQTADRALMPAVSLDGSRIAFSVGTVDGFQIFVLDLHSKVERQITRITDGAVRPSWSRDGRHIVYTRLAEGPSRIERVSVEGGPTEVVASVTGNWAEDAAVAPDGKWVALALSPKPYPRARWQLGVLALDSPGDVYPLTGRDGDDRAPAWKP